MIAVTGATGFLGSHLVCRLLKQGKTVKAIKRSSSDVSEFNFIYSLYFDTPVSQQKFTWAEGDVLDVPSLENAFAGADEVYHCAAVVSFNKSDKSHMMKTNVEGTANVVNVCLNLNIKKLAYISSIAALGREKSGALVSEKTKWTNSKLNSNYAISKHKAELEVWRGIEEGLNTVIVNPGVILGSGKFDKGSCKLIEMVDKGMPFYTHGINGYVDVEDVADAAIFLMEKNVFNERFVLVSENMDMKWFMNETATLLNAKKPFIEVNKFIAELSWMATGLLGLITGKKPAITKETARASLNKYYYSSDKIKALGFTFKPIAQTLADACSNYKKQQLK